MCLTNIRHLPVCAKFWFLAFLVYFCLHSVKAIYIWFWKSDISLKIMQIPQVIMRFLA
ncbi:hypothetical protein CY35_11G052400 [Sphagnum magellanicum]|nr:hypothetical protein CY35_11G052400 [Sphagnum magellanicum]